MNFYVESIISTSFGGLSFILTIIIILFTMMASVLRGIISMQIDGVESLNNVLLIGMTNRKDLLDEALLRFLSLDFFLFLRSIFLMTL